MAIVYLIRKKVFRQDGEKKTKWFAVQRKIQKKGGCMNAELAKGIATRTGFSEGEVQGILVELVKEMEWQFKAGKSVTISGLGSFQTAITSDGYDHPEQITPKQVRLSRIYFRADRKLFDLVRRTKYIRFPLSKYFPASMLTQKVIEEEKDIEEIPED